MFVKIALPIPSPKTFTYAVPSELVPLAAVGKRVLVPFGKKRLSGWIIEILSETPDRIVKEIMDLPDAEPLFDREDLVLYEWIAGYYIHPLGKVLGEILSGGLDMKSDRWIKRVHGNPSITQTSLSDGQKNILECLMSFPDGLSLSRLRRLTGKDNLYRDLILLEQSGLVISEERLIRPAVRPKREKWIGLREFIPSEIKFTPKQADLVAFFKEQSEVAVSRLPIRFRKNDFLKVLEQKGIIDLREKETFREPAISPAIGRNENNITLNDAQEKALTEIRTCITSQDFSPCLLHGVTGSGKTEIYLRTIDEVLQNNGGALYLVPEIALTTQLLSRIRERFPDQGIAVLHSGIPRNVRYDQWKRLRRGELHLAVGARSALFAPVQNLRLIIVDEEHDPSYKQDDRLRYNARDMALIRGKLAQATVILGSATPGIQTFYQVINGRYRYLELPCRVDNRPLPRVDVVDMRVERDERGRTPLLSHVLVKALQETLIQRKQVLLFLNRRGFHTFLFCADCGHVFTCPSCDLALTHHATQGALKCHHCDFTAKPPETCPDCGGSRVRSQGAGTERIEDEIIKLFPEARVARMDSDSTSRKGDAAKILQRLDQGKIDILIGTQMITKGHDFPDITLVGVLAADASLNIPDFRAAERTFQLLTQVSGRGGRGNEPGRVVIQTFNPGHYAVVRAQKHDYAGFYTDEIVSRRELGYPPFSRLIAFHFSSLKKEDGKTAVIRMGKRARKLAAAAGGKIHVIGPAESPLARLRGRYRWQMLLKGTHSGPLRLLSEKLLEETGSDLEIQVDVDPVHFM